MVVDVTYWQQMCTDVLVQQTSLVVNAKRPSCVKQSFVKSKYFEWIATVLAIHPCVTRPEQVCLNNGNCTIINADYICNCAAGWTGTNCGIQGGM